MRRNAIVGLLVGLLCALAAMPAVAEERTAVFQANVTVPFYGTNALGALTIVYDDVTDEGVWDFQGTIAGKPAYASGEGTFTLGGSGTTVFQLTMTSVDTWQMPGISPRVPRSAEIRSVGDLAYVSYSGRFVDVVALPLSISPDLSFPVAGVYTVTDAASGEQPITLLPATGVADSATASPTAQSVALIGAVAVVLVLFWLGMLGRKRLTTQP